MGNALKALLAERHIYGYSDFLAEYKRRANELDLPRGALPPTRSQYYRWISGQVRTLPRGDHCAVLERMFPGWTAEGLFSNQNHQDNSLYNAKADGGVLSSITPAIEPAILEGLWVTGYLLGGPGSAMSICQPSRPPEQGLNLATIHLDPAWKAMASDTRPKRAQNFSAGT